MGAGAKTKTKGLLARSGSSTGSLATKKRTRVKIGTSTRRGKACAENEDRVVAGVLSDVLPVAAIAAVRGSPVSASWSSPSVAGDNEDDMLAADDNDLVAGAFDEHDMSCSPASSHASLMMADAHDATPSPSAMAPTTATPTSNVKFALVVDGYGGPACANFIEERLPACVAAAAESSWWGGESNAPESTHSLREFVPMMVDAFQAVDEAFQAEVERFARGSGACATMVLAREDEFVLAQCGDCAGVLCVNGDTEYLVPSSPSSTATTTTTTTATATTTSPSRTQSQSQSRSPQLSLLTVNSELEFELEEQEHEREERRRRQHARPTPAAPSAPSAAARSTPFVTRRKLRIVDSDSPNFLIVATSSVWARVDPAEARDVVSKALARFGDADTAARKLLSTASALGLDEDDASVAVIHFVRPSPNVWVPARAPEACAED